MASSKVKGWLFLSGIRQDLGLPTFFMVWSRSSGTIGVSTFLCLVYRTVVVGGFVIASIYIRIILLSSIIMERGRANWLECIVSSLASPPILVHIYLWSPFLNR
jgi:hypothetical protein